MIRHCLPALLATLALAATAQEAPRAPKAGDVHVYAGDDRTERRPFEETVTVTAVDGERVRTRHVRTDRTAPEEGQYLRQWTTVRSGSTGTDYDPPVQVVPARLEVGTAWEATHQAKSPSGALSRFHAEYKVVAREKVATPAGEFDAYRIEAKGYLSGLSWQGGFASTQKFWYAPSVDRIVRSEYREQRARGADFVMELKSIRLAP